MAMMNSESPVKVTVSKKNGISIPDAKSITINGATLKGVADATISMKPNQPITLTLVIHDFNFQED